MHLLVTLREHRWKQRTERSFLKEKKKQQINNTHTHKTQPKHKHHKLNCCYYKLYELSFESCIIALLFYNSFIISNLQLVQLIPICSCASTVFQVKVIFPPYFSLSDILLEYNQMYAVVQ